MEDEKKRDAPEDVVGNLDTEITSSSQLERRVVHIKPGAANLKAFDAVKALADGPMMKTLRNLESSPGFTAMKSIQATVDSLNLEPALKSIAKATQGMKLAEHVGVNSSLAKQIADTQKSFIAASERLKPIIDQHNSVMAEMAERMTGTSLALNHSWEQLAKPVWSAKSLADSERSFPALYPLRHLVNGPELETAKNTEEMVESLERILPILGQVVVELNTQGTFTKTSYQEQTKWQSQQERVAEKRHGEQMAGNATNAWWTKFAVFSTYLVLLLGGVGTIVYDQFKPAPPLPVIEAKVDLKQIAPVLHEMNQQNELRFKRLEAENARLRRELNDMKRRDGKEAAEEKVFGYYRSERRSSH